MFPPCAPFFGREHSSRAGKAGPRALNGSLLRRLHRCSGVVCARICLEAALAGGAVAVVSGAAGELRRFLELFRFADPVAA
jgi:hypothetical protein